MRKVLLFVLGLCLFVACDSKDEVQEETRKAFDYGKVENNVYINSYFDFEMDLPEGWNFQTKEEMDALINKGVGMVAGDDENLKAVIKASEIQTASLLMGFKYERGAAVHYNPSMVLIAESVKSTRGVKSGKEYLFHARKMLMSAQIKYDEVSETFSKEVVDGLDFYLMSAKMNVAGVEIKQLYYTTIINDFSVSVILSYSEEAEKEELLKFFKSFKRK